MPLEISRGPLAERKRLGERIEMDCRKQWADCWSHTSRTHIKIERKSSLAHFRRSGPRADGHLNLVAQLQGPRTNDVFSCADVVSRTRHRHSPERTHDRRARLFRIRREECALDLRAWCAKGKEPRGYRGCHVSLLVCRWAISRVLCGWETKEARNIRWPGTGYLRCSVGSRRYFRITATLRGRNFSPSLSS